MVLTEEYKDLGQTALLHQQRDVYYIPCQIYHDSSGQNQSIFSTNDSIHPNHLKPKKADCPYPLCKHRNLQL